MDISKIKEKLNQPEVEAERKKALCRLITTEIILFISLIAGYYILKFSIISNEGSLFVIVGISYLIGLICFFYTPFWANKTFKSSIKRKCQYLILKFFNLKSTKAGGFMPDELRNSNLFAEFTDIEDDDVFTGVFDNVTYKVSETKLISKGRKSEWTVFKGIIISLPANKNFKSKTVITTKSDRNITNNIPYFPLIIVFVLFPILAPIFAFGPILWKEFDYVTALNWASIIGKDILVGLITIAIILIVANCCNKKDKFETAKTESVDFNKRFKILAQDQIEARYLVTTGFMERLNDLQLAFGTNNIKFSFFNDTIMIAIQTNKDLFELGNLFTPCPNEKYIQRFHQEMISIQKLIMHLKLTEKTGL